MLRQKRRSRGENSIFWDRHQGVGIWRAGGSGLPIGRARRQSCVLLQTDRPLDEYGWEQWKGWCGREDPPLQTDAGLNNACRLSLKTPRACISIFLDNWGSGQLQAWLGCCGEISFSAPTDELDLGEKGRLAAFLNTTIAPMPRLMLRSHLEIVSRHWWRSDRGLEKQQISEWVSLKLFLSDLLNWSVVLDYMRFYTPRAHLFIIAHLSSVVLAGCQEQVSPLKCRMGTWRGSEKEGVRSQGISFWPTPLQWLN